MFIFRATGVLSEMTPDYKRVILVKHNGTSYKSEEVSSYLRYIVNVSIVVIKFVN